MIPVRRKPRADRARRFYVVGCGAVGTCLATALVEAGWRLVGAWNRSERRGRAFGRRFGTRVTQHAIGAEVAGASLVLVTVSDRAVRAAGRLLAASKQVQADTIVAHTSGALPASALGRIRGARLASFHPLAAVPTTGQISLKSILFAVEGDAKSRRLLASAARAVGGASFPIRPERKAGYHAACSMASNLVVALVAAAAAEARRARVPGADTRMLALAGQALAVARARGLAAGLTGPIIRGDRDTVARHLRALSARGRPIYALLGARAVELGRVAGSSRRDATAISTILARARRR